MPTLYCDDLQRIIATPVSGSRWNVKARTRDPVLPASITTACSWLGIVSYYYSSFYGIAFTIFIDSFSRYLYLELLQRNSRSHPPKLLAAQASRNGLEQDIEPQQVSTFLTCF